MRFHFYDAETGRLHSNVYGTSIRDPQRAMESARANAPAGHLPIEGTFDYLSQRIDVETFVAVEYQPPAPTTDHEWDVTSKRWHLRAEVAARDALRQSARATIDHQERHIQPRAQREVLLNIAKQLGVDATHLEEVERTVANARQILNEGGSR